jgi:hypothetical protein
MRRILNQAANAAVKHKGSIFEIVYRRFVPRLGHNKTIGAIAYRLCHVIWIILHNGVRYEERGPSVCEKAKRARTSRMIRTPRTLGYRVEPAVIPACGSQRGSRALCYDPQPREESMGNLSGIVKQLKKERDRVERQLSGLNAALSAFVGVYGEKAKPTAKRRTLSAKARARMAAAQRARWKAWKAKRKKAA